MPVTRRSARSSTSGAGGKQQTLSFKHKVTKSIQAGGKKEGGFQSPSRSKEYIPEPSPEPAKTTTTVKTTTEEDEEGQPRDQEEEEAENIEEDGGCGSNRKLEQIRDQARAAVGDSNKSEAEARALKVSDAAVERYWAGIEASRMAKAVHKKHTEGLSTGEKVLRYFDVSSQYGVRFFLSFLSPFPLLFSYNKVDVSKG